MVLNATAMTAIAPRSSTTARLSRKIRAVAGRPEPVIASTASANAMSVATGIAHAWSAPPLMISASSAGTTMPPTAAITGNVAALRSASSPTTSSRLSSRPATKKNSASRPSLAHASNVNGPTVSSRRA